MDITNLFTVLYMLFTRVIYFVIAYLIVRYSFKKELQKFKDELIDELRGYRYH